MLSDTARRLLMLATATAIVTGCASPQKEHAQTTAPAHVSRFSTHPGGDALPPGWEPWVLSRFKRPTTYRLIRQNGHSVVHAQAEQSASGLVHRLALDPLSQPILQWHWKVDALIGSADNTVRHLEDSPVRIAISFDGDPEKLPLKERVFFDNMRLLTGQQLPYATLMYIWENRAPVNSVIDNLHTARIKMIVAESGPGRLGRWQRLMRNIVNDYRHAFGEEPGRIIAVGLMTDTDNTGETAEAWYGDIEFLQAQPLPARQ